MEDFSEPLLPESNISLIRAKDPSLITDAKDGSRKVPLDLLSRNSPDAYQGTLYSSAVSVAARYITVPTVYGSEQTLEFVGFTTAKAQELYQDKTQREHLYTINIGIEKWAIEYSMASFINGQDSSDDLIRIMRDAGINNDIQQAIMDPSHDKIRYIQPLSHWIEEIMQTNFDALKHMATTILVELGAQPGSVHLRGDRVPPLPDGHIALFKRIKFIKSTGCFLQMARSIPVTFRPMVRQISPAEAVSTSLPSHG